MYTNLPSQGNLAGVRVGRVDAQGTGKLCCQQRCDSLLLLLVLLLHGLALVWQLCRYFFGYKGDMEGGRGGCFGVN